MKAIRLHGRGGQGAVTAADMIATAAVFSGNYGSSLPMYGAERRGAPVVAFVRLNDIPIRIKTQIYTPDCLIVLDPRQKDHPQIYEGIKDKSTLIINLTHVPPKPLNPKIAKAGIVDATKIALEEIGIPAFNTCILGAFAATTGWIKLDAILTALENSFSGKLLERNIKSAERGYKEVTIVNW
jgi:2-oxoisovalerate ferredoxin oxidoreductase gamma subunit